MRGVALPRVARATRSCDRKRGEAIPTRPAPPIDFNNVRRFMDILSSPPLFPCSQMRFHYVRVQLSPEPGFAGYADMSILDIRTVLQKQLVHPTTLAGDRFTSDIVTNGRSPLAVGPRVQLASRIVRRHGQSEGVSHIGDAFCLQKPAAVAQIRVQDVASLVDDEVLDPPPPFEILSSTNGDSGARTQSSP